MKKRRLLGLLLILGLVLSGCSLTRFNIVGTWKDADGSIRVFNQDGTCKNVAEVDIGGPCRPTYVLSEQADSNGFYSLYLEQDSPLGGTWNKTTYRVKVINNDSMEIYNNASSSKPLYRLTRY